MSAIKHNNIDTKNHSSHILAASSHLKKTPSKVQGFLVLEDGAYFSGQFLGGVERAGEVVFNTSHSGYEEMATDPSYFHQILVMTSVHQGNYGASDLNWESDKIHIQGLVCLDMQQTSRDSFWKDKLTAYRVPVLSGVDTRRLVLYLRERGTVWGAVVHGNKLREAEEKAKRLMTALRSEEKDWPFMVATPEIRKITGEKPRGPRVAIVDFGVKQSIIQQVLQRSSAVCVFPPRTSARNILKWQPDGVLLSNGPGDPMDVQQSVQTVKSLLGKVFVFGICMGHQILALALGGSTYKLKFGHRGGNHPVRDHLSGVISVTSQNHGYAVKSGSLPSSVKITHTNLNDETIEGFFSSQEKCMGIQFHPESSPGPREASVLFDTFIKELKKSKPRKNK